VRSAALAVLLALNGAARAQTAPAPVAAAIRLDQSLFETDAVLTAEKADLAGKVSDIQIAFAPDGIHATGRVPNPLLSFLPKIGFAAVLDLAWVAPNAFEIRVREAKVSFIDVKSFTKTVLDAAKSRFDAALKGTCAFSYVGSEADGSRAIRVTLDMTKMLPAFPDLALTGIAVKDHELVLKVGKP
jgi:hypothetical protein